MRTYLLHSFAACFMLLSAGYISAQVTYEQDFTEDPNFTSYHEEAEWLASEGTYRVNTFDNLDAKYWAHSPQFENTTISKDFSVSFDMMTENGVFGTYPSITFQNYDPEEISNAGESFRIAFFWSSTISKKFRFLTRDGDNQTWGMESVTSYVDNTWYRFQIDYNSMDSTANIIIKDRASDVVLETLNDIQWHIQDVSYVCVGYYNQPNFGNDWSPIQIDNVVITQASMLTEICDNGIDDDGDGLIDLNDENCDCETFQPNSLIPNPSFEEMNCCPTDISMLDCATDWIQASDPTTDYVHTCGILGNTAINAVAPLPFPDGEGAVGFRDGSPGAANFKEYTGACLISPLKADIEYRLEMYVGFRDAEGSLDLDLAVYAAKECSSLPFGVGDNIFGCPFNDPNYKILGEQSVSGLNEWKKIIIDFTPEEDYNVLVIGPACAPNPNIALNPYFYFDDLIIAESSEFALELTIQGEPCDEDLILIASSEVEGDIQWYKDGIAIIGATDISYSVPFDNNRVGEYSFIINNSEGCFASESYEVLPDDLIGSEQVLETTLCPGEAVIVNGETYTEIGTYEQVVNNAAGCESKVIINISAESACTDCNPSAQNKLTIPTKKLTDSQYLIELSGETYILSESDLGALLNHASSQADPNMQSLIHYMQQIEKRQVSENSTQPALSDTYQFVRQVRVGAWMYLEIRVELD